MTVNELILLLDCYRGYKKSRHTANLSDELNKLYNFGLITHKNKCTMAGNALIDTILNKAHDAMWPKEHHLKVLAKQKGDLAKEFAVRLKELSNETTRVESL